MSELVSDFIRFQTVLLHRIHLCQMTKTKDDKINIPFKNKEHFSDSAFMRNPFFHFDDIF